MKEVRPTSGRVVSALFSILRARWKVGGAKFIDLFAGTGRVGLEALRRGAESCVFVESVKSRAEALRKVAGDSVVLGLEVRRGVAWLTKRGMTFDVVFADPPYGAGWCEELPAVAGLRELLSEGGVFVVEHSVREELTLSQNPNNLCIISVREYGETCLTFLQAQE